MISNNVNLKLDVINKYEFELVSGSKGILLAFECNGSKIVLRNYNLEPEPDNSSFNQWISAFMNHDPLYYLTGLNSKGEEFQMVTYDYNIARNWLDFNLKNTIEIAVEEIENDKKYSK